MAIPKVFVSSTCYDLQEERAQLERFISSYGFHPILSEYSGVYYDVDTHTHESCVNEVSHCDLFVLVISGRYGGKFKNGNGESITQAEYNKARELDLPIFTFVKSDVSAAQHYYKENMRDHDNDFARKITYPAIQKQSDAVSIFNFIDSVHRMSTNNGIETYQSFTDIECHLRKQWAGMFFSFLQKRKESDRVEDLSSILVKLAGSSSKLEVLVSSLHDKELGKAETSKLLNESREYSDCVHFLTILLTTLYNSLWKEDEDFKINFLKSESSHFASVNTDGRLAEYFIALPNVSYEVMEKESHGVNAKTIGFNSRREAMVISSPEWEKMEKLYTESFQKSSNSVRTKSLEESLKKVIKNKIMNIANNDTFSLGA
jgi:hypothetical protein